MLTFLWAAVGILGTINAGVISLITWFALNF